MSKIFMIVFVIFGTVVGSGFASGKEIMVYFSRFGNLSYLYIFLAVLLFFFVFYFFLVRGKKVLEILKNSKILSLLTLFVSIIFCASMLAGIQNLFSYLPHYLLGICFFVVIILCVISTYRGFEGLEKTNLILMPITSVIFLIVLLGCLKVSSNFSLDVNYFVGLLYSPLYVALNTCMSGLVISRFSENITKRQAFLACLFACLLLLSFLLLGNFVLLRNGESFFSQMPFLFLTSGKWLFYLAYIVILVGCVTTLVSLCYNIKTQVQNFCKSNFLSTIISITVPLVLSLVGFSHIVSFLYPFCSVLGVFMLVYLLVFSS